MNTKRTLFQNLGLVLVVAAAAIFSPVRQSYPNVIVNSTQEQQPARMMPSMSFFSSLPIHLVGEMVDTGDYAITLDAVTAKESTLSLTLTLANRSEHPIDLNAAVQAYLPTYEQIPLTTAAEPLLPGESTQKIFEYQLPQPVSSMEELMQYRLLYAPFGWSGPVILYRLSDTAPQQTVTPQSPLEPQAYGATGDPWKMLVLIYKNINTNYMEGGVQKNLTASMPDQDIENMKNDFLNLPHQNIVSSYSNGTAELEAHVVVVDRALTNLEPIADGYWPSPDVTRQELDLYAPKGKYDSVIVFWQASNPSTGQSLPVYGWGLGYWPYDYANGMTYATVFNLSWVWPNDACQGEVFLHEWLHGVTGFYAWRGFDFPYEDLHGAEEAGYVTDSNGCWKDWLKDYMRGLVYENGVRKALVTETWHGGSITTYNIQNWRGEYFNNEYLYGPPAVIRDDPHIDFFWELDSPHPLINADHFSARWTRKMYFNEGLYRFDATRDDGMRIWVDDKLILDSWYWGYTDESVDYYLKGGQHTIRVEAYEIDGWASATLYITPLSSVTYSIPAQDGWVLESGENTNAGGKLNTGAATLHVGDDAGDRQYKSVLSFNTGANLPDNAVITKVTLRLKLSGTTGNSPFKTHGNLVIDVKNGAFSNNANLQKGDFSAGATKNLIGILPPSPVSGWHSKTWSNEIAPYISLTGTTQFRLRFAKGDNDNLRADFLKFYSGNAGASFRPQLIIEYFILMKG